MNSTPSECVSVQILADGYIFKAVLVFKTCMNLIGCGLLVVDYVLAKKSSRPITFHQNANVVCHFMRISLFVLCLSYSSIAVYDYYRLSMHVISPCDHLANNSAVVVLRFITTTTTVAHVISLIVLALERILCTVCIVGYESASSPWITGFSLFGITTVYSLTANYFTLVHAVDPNRKLVFSSTRNSQNLIAYSAYSYSLLFSELFIIFVFLIIKKWNKYLHKLYRVKQGVYKQQQSRLLSIKFQINETINLMNVYAPIVIGQFIVFGIAILGGLFVPTLDGKISYEAYSALNEAVFIHTWSAHVFALIRFYKLRNYTRKVGAIVEEGGCENTDDYFKRQMNTFNAPNKT
uniref:G_PROTEIN_RECEP_F1_2 domain-containing protein n=1 Tax=Panagrellus redivivus TaxID=6233 RepID=A0A7E4VA91_PANRE